MRVIMTCGGTGGHIYPAVAIADEIKRREPDSDILFVGSQIGLEKDLVPKSGYEIRFITAGWLDRKNIIKNVKLPLTLMEGNRQSKEILKDFRPDVVIGTGGYASVPVMKAAQKMGIPTYIHEQNAVAGMANKMLERRAEKLFLGFAEASGDFKHPEKHIVAGNPVRHEFVDADRQAAREALGFGDKDFVILAFGGSQGAGRINRAMMNVIERFNGDDRVKVCLATGSYYYEAIKSELADRGTVPAENIMILEYIHDMAKYLASSDLVISRSGALTVAEVTACGRPAVFIPSPMVTGNHQYFNAKVVADRGGAVVIEEKDLDNDGLVEEIERLKGDPAALEDMAAGSLSCSPADATKIICDSIMG